MHAQNLRKFKAALKKASKIAIITHFNPDGDALGSSLALYHFLVRMGKKPAVIVPNAYPDFLDWMPGVQKMLVYSEQEKKTAKVLQEADMLFTLDFNAFKRLEKLGDLLTSFQGITVLIDHHQQPEIDADFRWHDVKATSTCELVYDLIADLKQVALIDRKIASCLYTGLMTDTGSFRYPGVNAKTHRILSVLLETGIKPAELHSAVYDNYSYDRMKLVGYALSEKLRMVPGLPVAYFTLSEKELQRFNYKKGDTEGLVNYPFSIKGVVVTALFNETNDHIKISLRSKGDLDMNRLARQWFDGGGHINAAGGKSRLGLEATEKRFVEAVKTLF